MATFERFVSLATTYGHPEPERLAHATVQYKASLQKCKDKRHHTVLLTGPPPPIPQAPGKEVKAKVLCAARTLEEAGEHVAHVDKAEHLVRDARREGRPVVAKLRTGATPTCRPSSEYAVMPIGRASCRERVSSPV